MSERSEQSAAECTRSERSVGDGVLGRESPRRAAGERRLLASEALVVGAEDEDPEEALVGVVRRDRRRAREQHVGGGPPAGAVERPLPRVRDEPRAVLPGAGEALLGVV